MYNKLGFSVISIIMLFSAFFFSCNKSSDAGLDIVPEDYLIKTSAVDTFRVVARTYKIDSLLTSNISDGLLGSYIDPIFGDFKASFVMEISPLTVPSFGTDPVLDSVVLYLRYDTVFGNKSVVQTINISEITERVRVDSSYFSNLDPSTLGPIPLSLEVPVDLTFKPESDSLLVLKLPLEFGRKLFDNVADWKDTTFATFFKGFLISTNSTIDASISAFNLFHSDTRLSLYYHNSTTDSLQYKFTVSNTCSRFNLFDQQYNSPDFIADLVNPEAHEDSVVYLQGGSGLKVKIQFPYLDLLKNQGTWGVNRAELIINADPSTISTQSIYSPPTNVVLYAINDEGKLEFLSEYLLSNEYLGVKYSSNQYIFDISFITQKIITGKRKNNGFVLMVKDGNIIPSRIVLSSGKHSSPMKLALTLTKL